MIPEVLNEAFGSKAKLNYSKGNSEIFVLQIDYFIIKVLIMSIAYSWDVS